MLWRVQGIVRFSTKGYRVALLHAKLNSQHIFAIVVGMQNVMGISPPELKTALETSKTLTTLLQFDSSKLFLELLASAEDIDTV